MSRSVVVGIFVFGALVILILGVFLIGKRQLLFSESYNLRTEFMDVGGLASGSEVRIGGLRKGSVKEIRLPRTPNEKISVLLSVEKDTKNIIRRDSIASIDTEGLLGNKYVSISFGSAAAAPVSDGDFLMSQPPSDYSDIIKRTNAIIGQTGEALEKAKNTLDTINRIGENIENLTGKIDRGQGTIGALVNDRSLYNQANQILDKASRTADTLNNTAETLSTKATTVMDQAGNAVDDIRRTTSRIAQNADPMLNDIKQGASSFRENMEAIKHNWFFRGYFNNRGYYDLADVTKNEIKNVPSRPYEKVTIPANKLFDKPETAELKKTKELKKIGNEIERNPPGLVVIAAYAGRQGTEDKNLEITRAQAGVVRQYLVEHFKIDEKSIVTKGFGESPGLQDESPRRVEILFFGKEQARASETQ